MRAVPALDATGLRALRDVVVRSRRDGTLVLLSEVHMQPLVALSRSDALRDIGEENLFGDLDLALARAGEHLAALGESSQPGPGSLVGAK